MKKLFFLFFITILGCEPENINKVPILDTSIVSQITNSSAVCGGNITADNGQTVISRGVCWSIEDNPTIKNSKTTDGAGAGSFVSTMTNLNPGTTYFVRAYATNSSGTGYGMTMSFKTLGQIPSATIQQASNITITSVTFNGIVNANYLSTSVTFEYGISTAYGQTISAAQSPITGNIDTNVNVNVSGLSPGTTYHFRLKTTNSLGTFYSNDMSFTTLGQKPTAITLNAKNVKSNSATLYGTVNANLLTTNIVFEYGTTAGYGNSASTTPSSATGNSDLTVMSTISGLSSGTIYHFRIKAENQLGVTYGNDNTFITSTNVSDIDGNIYTTVIIGTQTWFVENLKTTKYNDGISIPIIIDNNTWANLTSPGCCWYNNDKPTYNEPYGALYNWYVVNTGKLCPSGWHIPSDSEWALLETALGGSSIAAGKMKETGTTHWRSPNTAATNESGFTLLPSGDRGHTDGTFWNLGNLTFLWSITEYNSNDAWIIYADYSNARTLRDHLNKKIGLAVRCLKD